MRSNRIIDEIMTKEEIIEKNRLQTEKGKTFLIYLEKREKGDKYKEPKCQKTLAELEEK